MKYVDSYSLSVNLASEDVLLNYLGEGSLEALVPLGLLGRESKISLNNVLPDGLVPIRILLKKGLIIDIQEIPLPVESSLKLLLPRFVEPHAHLDKAFTWNNFPNLEGTYEEAYKANLEEYEKRTGQDVLKRAEKSLDLALKNGIRAIRSHVDSFGTFANQTWDILIDLKRKWSPFIELQFVALVPLKYWESQEGKLLASRIAREGGLLGGVLLPPFDLRNTYNSLIKLIELANDLNCGIDIHIDESQIKPGYGLNTLIHVLEKIELHVPITCSHASSMSFMSARPLRILADKLANYGINVIALPLTNSWLLGRNPIKTPIMRPLAPIYQLQKAGVTVAIGGDNVQDPWFPSGNFDPISLMSFSMPIAQLEPWHRLGLSPFTTAPASVLNLDWGGTFSLGSPADFVLLDSRNWNEALAKSPSRKIMVKGKWL